MSSHPTAGRARLLELFRDRAVYFGDFTLASGKKSTYYINSKKAFLSGEILALLGELFWDTARGLNARAVGGLEIGAIPLTAATVLRAHAAGQPVEGFFVRKQAKEHGSKERVEGGLKPGDRVLILDDVLTTGGSALSAVEAAEAAGALVVGVACIVDRLEGATATLAAYPFRPIFTIRDFGITPPGG